MVTTTRVSQLSWAQIIDVTNTFDHFCALNSIGTLNSPSKEISKKSKSLTARNDYSARVHGGIVALDTTQYRAPFASNSQLVRAHMGLCRGNWVATVALGFLARSQADSEDHSSKQNNVVQTFWAPFLLLHLGGPETITAYSLEDNELWLRRFLGLIVQVGVAIYVLIRSWSNTALTYIFIPMFIAGMIKYGERNVVLLGLQAVNVLKIPCSQILIPVQILLKTKTQLMKRPEPRSRMAARHGQQQPTPRSTDTALPLRSYYERKDSYSKIENKSAKDAFELIAIELGFMYDLRYTKASVVHSQFGVFFRFISLCCCVSALVTFSIIIDSHSYSQIDISITYILLVGAVALEVYALIAIFFSDWTELWFIKSHNSLVGATCACHGFLANCKRWSGSMTQYNLISSCLRKVQPIFIGIHNLPWIGELLDKYRIESCKKLLEHRGDNVIEKRYGPLHQFRWSINDVEFDHSLLLWHIATDLCYNSEDTNKLDPKCRISKCLSDYLLYILVFCPSMLPEGIGEIKYRDTHAEALRFFLDEEIFYVEVMKGLCFQHKVKKKKYIKTGEACVTLLGVDFGDAEEQIKGDRNQSVLFYGCRLARQLQSLDERWEIISEVLVEMLTYAANKCTWKEHGQRLSKGGELLTHVRLLMEHLGLSKQYRIQKRYYDEPQRHYLNLTCSCVCSFLQSFCIDKCRSLRCKCVNPFVKKSDTSLV
ncbi:hypothetical protein EZV62_003272 [Acer yangbiense]|uniref:DUF4220 domain-containing protein n=1 Tax=Acer yangbiense TaxID=1000413 RepID=A0A5C7IG88_9ROSI|nr:hypothetical protein EZV62_003272 [Acer yangbiense]